MALGSRVEEGEISALYRNSQNKLLSVLGPLCLLHRHPALTLAQSVSAPHVLKKQPLLQWEKHHRCPWPGTDLRAWYRVVGRKEGEAPKSQPVLQLCLPPSSPSHVTCFPSTSLSRQEGLWQLWVGSEGTGRPAGLLSRAACGGRGWQRVLGTGGQCPLQPWATPAQQGQTPARATRAGLAGGRAAVLCRQRAGAVAGVIAASWLVFSPGA